MNQSIAAKPPATGMRQRILRNLGTLGGGSAIAALLALAATIANSRALSIVDFGTLVLLQASALLLAGIATLSPQQPVIKLGVAALHAGDSERFTGLVLLGLAVDVAAAAVAGTLGLALVLLLPDLIGLPADRIAPAAIVAGSLFLQGFKTSEGIFRAFDRFDLQARTLVATAVLQLAMAGGLWALDAPFIWYGVLAALTLALPSMLQLWLSLRLLRHHGMRFHAGAWHSASVDLREFAQYCWSTWLIGTLDSIRMNGDSALVGFLVSVEAAGLYGVAKQVAGVVRKGTVIYASVMFPELASLAARRDRVRLVRLLRQATLGAFGVTVVLAGGAWLLGEWALTRLFGPSFAAADGALVLLVVAAGLQIASATFSMTVQAFIKPATLLQAHALAAIVFLPAIWVGLLALGLAGAGLAQILFALALGGSCTLLLKTKGVIGSTRVRGTGHAD